MFAIVLFVIYQKQIIYSDQYEYRKFQETILPSVIIEQIMYLLQQYITNNKKIHKIYLANAVAEQLPSTIDIYKATTIPVNDFNPFTGMVMQNNMQNSSYITCNANLFMLACGLALRN